MRWRESGSSTIGSKTTVLRRSVCQMKAIRAAGSLVAVILAAAAAASPATADATPGSIQQCLQGGWQNLISEDGTAFQNQGACVSYLARGGALGCPSPQVGEGPLTGGQVAGPGQLDITGSGFTEWRAYSAVELTLDGCGTVRFYNFETWGVAVPGGNLGQACPTAGVFWWEATINLRCYLLAGRTVRAITIYDGSGSAAGHLDIPDVAVPPMPTFRFGSAVESAPQQLTLPVLTGNAEEVSMLQIHYTANAPGYAPCGSGGEGYFPYFGPTDPNASPAHPIRVVTWSGSSITLDFSGLRESEFYPGGFTLCGVVAYWGAYVAAGTAFPTGTFTFYG